jgi:hypothetical protein
MAVTALELQKILKNARSVNFAAVTADEYLCDQLMKYELTHRKRAQVVLRLHSRLNKVRAQRERIDLMRKLAFINEKDEK